MPPHPQTHLRSATPTHGSQTQTSTHPLPQPPPTATLRLRATSPSPDETSQRVRWAEDVVDNEGLGRKKSKGVCVCSMFYPSICSRPSLSITCRERESLSMEIEKSDEMREEKARQYQKSPQRSTLNQDYQHELKGTRRELISWAKSAAYTTARAKSASLPPNLLLLPPPQIPPVPSRTMPGELDRLGTTNHEGGEAARAIMVMIIIIRAMGVEVGGKEIVKGKARHRERDGNRGMRMRSSRHRRQGGVLMVGGRERLEALFKAFFFVVGGCTIITGWGCG